MSNPDWNRSTTGNSIVTAPTVSAVAVIFCTVTLLLQVKHRRPAVNTRQSTVNVRSACVGKDIARHAAAAASGSPRCGPASAPTPATAPSPACEPVATQQPEEATRRKKPFKLQQRAAPRQLKFVGGSAPASTPSAQTPPSPRGDADKAGPPAPDKSRRHPSEHCTRGDAASAPPRTCPRSRSRFAGNAAGVNRGSSRGTFAAYASNPAKCSRR